MSENLYVDIHVLQDVPPANLNRDDSGSPKSVRYGGVDRLRVSSQAWKRAVRMDFQEHMEPSSLGYRTRRMRDTLKEALITAGVSEEAASASAISLLKQIGIKSGKREDETAYLFFFSRPQLNAIAEEVAARQDLWSEPDELAKQIDVQKLLGRGHSLDVALFGRMVADLASLNVDAACQVAHAIATHSSPAQFDYFTAVDDAQEDTDETGAGMIGTIEFGSATLYRYATINVPGLIANMDDTAEAIKGTGQFVRSFILSMPTGHQNTFAAHSRPGLVLVQIRNDQPVNYVSAFEKPVQAKLNGYLNASVRTLHNFVQEEAARWGDAPIATIASYIGGTDALPAFGPSLHFDELMTTVTDCVAKAVS